MSTNPWLRDYRPLSIAHRGHCIAYPENTFIAYQKAIELGVEMIECDVNITSDGKLVMIHDSTLNRTTNGTGRVSSLSFDEVQQLDAGAKFKSEFAGTRIPATEETILFFKEAKILSCFEVKVADVEEAKRIALLLLELFQKHNVLDTAFMSSYSHEALQVAKAKCPELLLAPERLPDDAPPDAVEAVRQAKSFPAPVIQHEYSVLSTEVVKALHENEVGVWAWPTTTEASLVTTIEVGADAVMGDDIQTMMDVLNRMRPAK